MNTHRLNIDFPADEFVYLKMLCAKEKISIKDFIVPLVIQAIEDYEDEQLAKMVEEDRKDFKLEDCIPAEEMFKRLGWE